MAAEAIEVQNIDRAVANDLIGHIGVTDRHVPGLGSFHDLADSMSHVSPIRSPVGRTSLHSCNATGH